MIKLYSEKEYSNAIYKDKLPLQCEYCNNIYYKSKNHIHTALSRKYDPKYCSVQCRIASGKQSVICKHCGRKFTKLTSQIKRTRNHFCSQSCAATYNNLHKCTGTRRSKLEVYLEQQLINKYPDMDFVFNDKYIIQSELDIYIPSLKLAFELNGIYHYEPIHGINKLSQIQNNDQNKFQKCQQANISLCIIDTSQQKRFTKNSSQKYLEIIVSIIEKNPPKRT